MALKEYFKVDETGKPLYSVILDENNEETNEYILGWVGQGDFYEPKYDFENKIWIEGLSTEQKLSNIKEKKIHELNELCNEQIANGFTSPSLTYEFEFEPHDQNNLTQQAILLLNDPTLNSIMWKTKNVGIVELTREQFFTLLKESETHKRNNIGKFWMLKAQVEQATTLENVEAIYW